MSCRLIAIPILLACSILHADAVRPVRLDSDGTMRWDDDGSEVVLFGVNYYPPFSIDYDLIQRRGLDHEQAIRNDVVHFQRLGLTSIRLHCWDREISDKAGNLVDNEHLRLLDLLIHECKKRDIYAVLTPIAWWGSPKPGGFSDDIPMFDMTTKRETWEIQRRHLSQFVQHRNRYTGLSYMDDPAVVAFEVINEPRYPNGTDDSVVTDYINALVSAIKETGCRKPVFYNCWQNRHAAAAASSMLDGVTFGWYPTGLVSGATITTDELPKVDDFPSMRDPLLNGKARMVYEFDAADVHGSYMYPAIARVFRGGGAQIANQFQYDPMCLSDTNKNWQTHYLNLLYTPAKAISFAIAGEAFRRLPRLQRYGSYPESTRFGEFHVLFQNDLSEWLGTTAFMYSNNTEALPPNPSALTRVWGCGSSPLVSYTGIGAYFLDRVADGLWSLQVYPDAVQVADPYAGSDTIKTSLFKRKHEMRISIPDLGPNAEIWPDGDSPAPENVTRGTFGIQPGAYWVTREKQRPPENPTQPVPYVCPPVELPTKPLGTVKVDRHGREGYPLAVTARLGLPDIQRASIRVRSSAEKSFAEIPMSARDPYAYEGTIPGEMCTPGTLQVYVEALTSTGRITFPGGTKAIPKNEKRHTFFSVEQGMSPVRVNASKDVPGGAQAEVQTDRSSGRSFIRLSAERFGPEPSCAGVVFNGDAVPDPGFEPTAISARLRGGPDTSAVEIGFKLTDGSAFGGDFPVGPEWQDVTIPLVELRPLWGSSPKTRRLTALKEISLITGTWLLGSASGHRHWVDLQSLSLVRSPEILMTEVASAADPVVLLHFGESWPTVRGGASIVRVVPGMTRGDRALQVTAGPFGPSPDCRSFRVRVPDGPRSWIAEKNATVLLIRARATKPHTRALELVLLEADGSPWGLNVPLIQQWHTIRVPLNDLRFFSNWPHPEQRGNEGDMLNLQDLTSLNICFGAWLYGEHAGEQHGFEIQDIAVEIGRK